MDLGPTSVWSLIRQTFKEGSKDQAPQLRTALALHTALSIAPLLAITLGNVAFILGTDAAGEQITRQLGAIIGDDGGHAIEDMTTGANNRSTQFVDPTILCGPRK